MLKVCSTYNLESLCQTTGLPSNRSKEAVVYPEEGLPVLELRSGETNTKQAFTSGWHKESARPKRHKGGVCYMTLGMR
jgi:hypothetical protein